MIGLFVFLLVTALLGIGGLLVIDFDWNAASQRRHERRMLRLQMKLERKRGWAER